MIKNFKINILSILIIIITFVIVRQSIVLHRDFKNIEIPTRESRQLGNMSTYKWLTVKKLSHKYNISEQEIFKNLEIIPHRGDENIPIIELAKKYNKAPEEIKKNLRKFRENHKDLEGTKHE
ncbi:hypothetical protein [Clostridium sp. OS1-26]|uniref:hypothetical protein n=1 Tax=Clostridium sp. OS1-26 TaxID=3070681 RepID=UPI0027E1E371|nr:hypothetical protein [Clostridium sp. OS1-26]WML33650.1 hypothetical protein RCG18_20220 [Clostridium sp. OS1-26]